MQTSFFDVNSMLNDLALFDQAVVNSAANMKVNFDAQTAGLSQSFATVFQSFDEAAAVSAENLNLVFGNAAIALSEQIAPAFAAVDAAALNSSMLFGTSFNEALTLITAGFAETQTACDMYFALMSANTIASFMLAYEGITTILALLNDSAKSSCTDMESVFASSFTNITTNFGNNLTMMSLMLTNSLTEMSGNTALNAGTISGIMLASFALITAGMEIMSAIISGKLDEIKSKFEETAQAASDSFSDNMNIIGTVSDENTGKIDNGFSQAYDAVSKLIGNISGLISIFTGLNKLIQIFNVQEAASTAMVVANTAANTANSASQLIVISTTAGVGIAATGAAAGMLAFGAAVLMICAGIALVIAALALLFSMLGKGSSVDTNQLNDLKNPKVEPVSLETCASGGFPSMGQMFIAREAGPELVGTIGNRNAVVNNNQIVESVSSGVYQAVRSALKGGGSESVIQVFIGNDQLDEYIVRSQQRRSLQTNGLYA